MALRVAGLPGVEHVLGEVEVDAVEPPRDLVDGGRLVDHAGVVPAVDVVAEGEEEGPELAALRDGVVVELAEGLLGWLAIVLCMFTSGSSYRMPVSLILGRIKLSLQPLATSTIEVISSDEPPSPMCRVLIDIYKNRGIIKNITRIQYCRLTFRLRPVFVLISSINLYIEVLFGSGCSHSFRGIATWLSILNDCPCEESLITFVSGAKKRVPGR